MAVGGTRACVGVGGSGAEDAVAQRVFFWAGQNTLSHNAHGNIVLLEEASSELIGNVISHGPLGGIIIRGNTTVGRGPSAL